MDSGYAKPAADLVHGPDGPQLFAFDLFFVLGEHQSCVPLRKLHQPLLLPLLRNDQIHLLAALGTQPLSDDPAVLQLRLNPEFPRDKRSSGIELLDKAG